MEVGKRIRALRTARGLTQEELGKLLGVKKAAVQKYENGSVENLNARQFSNCQKFLTYLLLI